MMLLGLTYLKVRSLVSVHPKSIMLDQMTNLDMILYVLASLYRFVKIGKSPQFPAEFRNGQHELSQYYNTRLLTGNFF